MARLVQSGEFREVSHIYYSTMPRARETAAIVRDAYTHELELLEHPNIDELRVGDGDGLTWAEFAERFDVPDWDVDPHLPNAPGGESLLGFYERATTALTEISLRHPEGTVFATGDSSNRPPSGSSASIRASVCNSELNTARSPKSKCVQAR